VKQEFLKLIEMNKKGKISDDQMAELLEALMEDNKRDVSENAGVASTAGKLLDSLDDPSAAPIPSGSNKKKKNRSTDGNRISRSNVIMPEEGDFVFEDNRFKLSNFYETEFGDNAEFTNNSIQFSHFAGIKMKGGTINDCSFKGSNLDSVKLWGATLADTNFNTCKISDLEICNESEISDVKFRRITIKGMSLKESSLLKDIRFDRLTFVNADFIQTEISNAIFHRGSFTDLTFRNVKFDDCVFNRCTFKDSEIRNVDLQDFKFSNINFSNQTIDGNDAFCSLIEN